eukprot:432461_1
MTMKSSFYLLILLFLFYHIGDSHCISRHSNTKKSICKKAKARKACLKHDTKCLWNPNGGILESRYVKKITLSTKCKVYKQAGDNKDQLAVASHTLTKERVAKINAEGLSDYAADVHGLSLSSDGTCYEIQYDAVKMEKERQAGFDKMVLTHKGGALQRHRQKAGGRGRHRQRVGRSSRHHRRLLVDLGHTHLKVSPRDVLKNPARSFGYLRFKLHDGKTSQASGSIIRVETTSRTQDKYNIWVLTAAHNIWDRSSSTFYPPDTYAFYPHFHQRRKPVQPPTGLCLTKLQEQFVLENYKDVEKGMKNNDLGLLLFKSRFKFDTIHMAAYTADNIDTAIKTKFYSYRVPQAAFVKHPGETNEYQVLPANIEGADVTNGNYFMRKTTIRITCGPEFCQHNDKPIWRGMCGGPAIMWERFSNDPNKNNKILAVQSSIVGTVSYGDPAWNAWLVRINFPRLEMLAAKVGLAVKTDDHNFYHTTTASSKLSIDDEYYYDGVNSANEIVADNYYNGYKYEEHDAEEYDDDNYYDENEYDDDNYYDENEYDNIGALNDLLEDELELLKLKNELI